MDKQDLLKRTGRRVAKLRIEAGITQEELAYRCGKDYQSINRFENGRHNATLYYLHEIASGLGVKTKDLIDY